MPPRRLRSPVVPWKGSLPLPIGSHRPTKWPIPAEARRCAPQLGARRPTLDGGTTSTCSAPGSSVLTASSSHHPQIERDSNRSQLIDLFPTSTMAARHPHGGNSAAPRPGVLLAQWPAAVCACGSQRAPTTSPCSRTRSCSGAPLAPTERPTSLAQQCPSSVNGKTYSLGTMGARSLSEASVDGETPSLGTSWCPSLSDASADGKTYFLGTTVPVVSQREDLLPWHHGCPFTLRGIS